MAKIPIKIKKYTLYRFSEIYSTLSDTVLAKILRRLRLGLCFCRLNIN